MKRKLLFILCLLTLSTNSYSFWTIFIEPAVQIINSITSGSGNKSDRNNEPDEKTLEKYKKQYLKDLDKPKKEQKALQALTLISLKQGDYIEAEKYYRSLNEEIYPVFLEIVKDYKAKKRTDLLEKFFLEEQSTRLNSQFQNIQRDASYELTQIYINKKNLPLAVKNYDLASTFDTNPDNIHSTHLKIVALGQANGDKESLINFLENEINNKSTGYYIQTYRESVFKITELYISKKDFDKAEKYYKLAESIADNSNQQRLKALDREFENKKELEDALHAGEVGNPEGYIKAANIYRKMGQENEVQKYMELAANLGHLDAIVTTAINYYNIDNYIITEKYLKMAVAKNDVESMLNLGWLYLLQDKESLAEKYLKMAADKGNIDAMVDLGYLYYDAGKYQSASKYLNLAMRKGASYERMGSRRYGNHIFD